MQSSRRELLAAAAAGVGALAATSVGRAGDPVKPKAAGERITIVVPSIVIDSPLPGTALGRQFAVSGRYALEIREDGKSPRVVKKLAAEDVIEIKCTLRRQDNTDVQTETADWEEGYWLANFSLTDAQLLTCGSGMKLIAVITVNSGTPYANEVGSLTAGGAFPIDFTLSVLGDARAKAPASRKIGKKHKPKGTIANGTGPEHVSLTAYHKGKPIGTRKSTTISANKKEWNAEYEFTDSDHNQEVTDVVTLFAINPATGRPGLYSVALTGLKVDKDYTES